MSVVTDSLIGRRQMRLENVREFPDCYTLCPACATTPDRDCYLCLNLRTVTVHAAKAWEPPEVPEGWCQCGCGEKTKVSRAGRVSRWLKGHSRPARWAPLYVVQDCGHETPCWLWLHGRHVYGYGVAYFGAKGDYAHRVFYERFRGPIPDGLTLDHLCRNPPCVNPDHLDPVTHKENVRRGKAAKLSAADIEAIQNAPAEVTNLELAEKYGVNNATISRRRRGLEWHDGAYRVGES